MTGSFALLARTRRAALKEAVARMKQAGLDTPVLDARLIVQHALGVDWQTLFLAPDAPLTKSERDRLDNELARLAAHEPVSRIVGRRHFWTLTLAVSPDTLDPRPETETLIEAVIAAIPDRSRPLRLLDLGTGTGALLLALLKEYPNATGVAVDSSPGALAVALSNAVEHGLADRAQFVESDWAASVDETFDLVVSNPPYITHADLAELPRAVRDYDPLAALDGGPDGLDAYRAIIAVLPRLLRDTGFAVLELGAGQRGDVAALAIAAGLGDIASRADLAGIDRALILRRIA